MATLPAATTTLNNTAGAFGTGTGYIVVMGCVQQNADYVPRIFASTAGLLSEYLYAPAVDYCSIHFAEPDLPVIFVGLPIATPGVVLSQNNVGVTGTSDVSIAVGVNGSMDKTSGVVTVTSAGTGQVVGTASIALQLSCDGGESVQNVLLGTNTTYTIPNLGLVLTFGAGTLNQGDVFQWTSSAPMWGSTAMTSAWAALAAQQNLARSTLAVGEVPTSTFANYVLTQANNYATANERFTYARAEVSDFLPLPTMSQVQVKMVGAPSLTFAASGHTITRATGSWITDGFVTGQIVSVAGSTSNNGNLGACTVTSATVLTFTSGLVNETATAATVTASNGLTFAASGFTITRTAGSFITEGFAVGQAVSIAGTTSNNTTTPLAITALSATVMTFAAGIANEGPLLSSAVTIAQVQTFGADVAAKTSSFGTVVGDRIDLGYGHGFKQSPITGWVFRRPASWAASIREYEHDVEIPCWRKSDGPLNGWSITDDNGNIVEYDERVDGGALAGGFTCLRSYGNGPLGAFVALSLTRGSPGSLLSRTQNMAVANLACTTVQTATENAIGDVLVLNSDGTGTNGSLSLLEKMVNKALQLALLQNFAEGPRATNAVWTASRTDILNVPGATLNGNLALELNGTLEQINTQVNVQTAGA